MARIRTIKPEFFTDDKVGESAPAFYIYCIAELGSEEAGPCKVGIATNLGKRLSSLQGGNWRLVVLAWSIRLSDRDEAKEVEQHCLRRLRPNPYSANRKLRLKSEWVSASPRMVLEAAIEYLNADTERVTKVA